MSDDSVHSTHPPPPPAHPHAVHTGCSQSVCRGPASALNLQGPLSGGYTSCTHMPAIGTNKHLRPCFKVHLVQHPLLSIIPCQTVIGQQQWSTVNSKAPTDPFAFSIIYSRWSFCQQQFTSMYRVHQALVVSPILVDARPGERRPEYTGTAALLHRQPAAALSQSGTLTACSVQNGDQC